MPTKRAPRSAQDLEKMFGSNYVTQARHERQLSLVVSTEYALKTGKITKQSSQEISELSIAAREILESKAMEVFKTDLVLEVNPEKYRHELRLKISVNTHRIRGTDEAVERTIADLDELKQLGLAIEYGGPRGETLYLWLISKKDYLEETRQEHFAQLLQEPVRRAQQS